VPGLRRSAAIVSLLGAEIAATIALHRLGRVEGFAIPKRALGAWVLHAQTEELIAVTARLAGLALAWWLLAATLLSLARRVVPGWKRLRALDALSPVAVRRIVERAVAVGVGASLGLSGVRPIGAVTVPTRPRVDVPVVRSAAPASRPADSGSDTTRTAPAGRGHSGHPANVVVVRAGDNLWVLARRALEGEDRAVPSVEIAPYWRRVIAANASGLRSHDPNLIFPGERIVLPPVSGPDPAAG
jgi:hypothetical protein